MSDSLNNLVKFYYNDVSEDLISEVKSFRCEFKIELQQLHRVTEILKLIAITKMISSFPESATVCMLFIALPVTVASAERSFSKLKITKIGWIELLSIKSDEKSIELG